MNPEKKSSAAYAVVLADTTKKSDIFNSSIVNIHVLSDNSKQKLTRDRRVVYVIHNLLTFISKEQLFTL